MKHELKTWKKYFAAIFQHQKDFEVRKDDRNYQVGDELLLKEWDEDKNEYTGREILVYVSYILYGGQFGIEIGYVVMSIKSYR